MSNNTCPDPAAHLICGGCDKPYEDCDCWSGPTPPKPAPTDDNEEA